MNVILCDVRRDGTRHRSTARESRRKRKCCRFFRLKIDNFLSHVFDDAFTDAGSHRSCTHCKVDIEYPEEIAALQRDYAALWGPLSDLLKKLSALVEL
mgnify:CR=1 FL=1